MKKNRLIICCLLAAGMVGCSARQTRMLSGTQTPRKGTISKEEIRDELAKFEDWFVSMMKQTAEEMDTASGTRRMERNNIQMQTRILEALHAMSEADDSIVAFLDTWGLIVRLKLYVEQGPGRTLYGEYQSLAVSFMTDAESEMERIGNLFLTPPQFDELKKGIYSFAQQNPIQGTYGDLVVYATKVKEKETSVFLKTIRIPMAPIRAMEGVDKTADSILKIRDSVDRFTNVTEQLPESSRWQMSILIDDFEESEMTQQFLKSLDDFSQSSGHLVEVLNAMPQQLRTELVTFLNESEQAQSTLQTTMKTAAETVARAEQMLLELQKTTLAINGTAVQADETAVAVKDASDSIQKLVMMFKRSQPLDANAPPPFGMRDFDTMLLNAGQTAAKVADAAAQIQRAMESESQTQLQAQLHSLIDHIAWRLFQLLLAAFALVLACRYVTKRWLKKQ